MRSAALRPERERNTVSKNNQPDQTLAARPKRPAKGARKNAKGQAVIWLLGTMAASAAVLYGVFTVGQITSAKQKTVNAADAAAMAGGTMEARALNLMAYNNRAVLANEVFLVQTVGMQGWLQYIKNTADNIEPYARWIPYAGPYLSRILTAVEEFAEISEKAVGYAVDGQAIALRVLKTGVEVSHLALSTLLSPLADRAAGDVAAANKVQFGDHLDSGQVADDRPLVKGFTFVKNGEAWIDFTRQYKSDKDRTDYAKDVLLRSRDQFTGRSRGGAWWMEPPTEPVMGFDKRGGTELKGLDQWESQDTYEFWHWGMCGKPPLPCKQYEAIGWGRSNVDDDSDTGSLWSPSRDAQKKARNGGDKHSNWDGVPKFYDIKDRDAKNRATLGLDYIVAVKRARDANLTASNLNMGKKTDSVAGSSEMDEKLLGEQTSAIGKARVFFERPASNIGDWTASSLYRHDSAKEYGSLYSPYWQVRLTDVSRAEKIGYMTALGMSPADAALTFPLTPGAHE